MNNLQALENLIKESGSDDLFTMLNNNEDKKEKIDEFISIIDRPETYEKGLNYESLISIFFEDFADIEKRVKTDTNEFDLYIDWNPWVRAIMERLLPDLLSVVNGRFLIECKNYPERKIGVTWVAKFLGVLSEHNFSFGIMFSRKGLTGEGTWTNATGYVKKFALKNDKYLLNVNQDDFKDIKNNGIIKVMDQKLTYLRNNISLPLSDTEEK